MSGETRKLQKVGGGTYTVSIPKEWATEQSLSAGDTIQLYPDGDGTLVVCGGGETTPDDSVEITLAPDGPHHLVRTLRAAYAAGLEELTLSAPAGIADDERRRLDRLVRERTGTRIAAESEDAVTIQTSLDDAEVSIRRTVVRLQFVTLSLFRTAVDLALDPSVNGRDRIDERRADVRRLCSLVTRQFSRSLSRPATAGDLGVDRPTAFDCYRTAQGLDRFADHATDIAIESDESLSDDAVDRLRSIAETVRMHAEEATTAVVEGATVEEARALRATRADVASMVADVDGDTAVERRLIDLLVSCADAGDRVADVALEAAMRCDA